MIASVTLESSYFAAIECRHMYPNGNHVVIQCVRVHDRGRGEARTILLFHIISVRPSIHIMRFCLPLTCDKHCARGGGGGPTELSFAVFDAADSFPTIQSHSTIPLHSIHTIIIAVKHPRSSRCHLMLYSSHAMLPLHVASATQPTMKAYLNSFQCL